MVERADIEDAVLQHLHEVAHMKRGMLEVATAIQADYPTQARLILVMIRQLTRSADRLLGDTVVDGPC